MKYSGEVRDPVIDAYYRSVVAAGEAARARAQAAYAIASTFTGGLVGVGIVTGLKGTSGLAEGLYFAAVVVWVFAAVTYLAVVGAVSLQSKVGISHTSPDDLVTGVLTDATATRRAVERRALVAHVLAAVAIALTIWAGAVVVARSTSNASEATIDLSPSAAGAIRGLCRRSETRLTGTLNDAALSAPFVRFELPGHICGRAPIVVYLPRDSIVDVTRAK